MSLKNASTWTSNIKSMLLQQDILKLVINNINHQTHKKDQSLREVMRVLRFDSTY